MPSLWNSSVLGLTALTMGLVGCADKPASNGPETSPPPATATADTHGGRDHGGHAHPSEGPHHGELIELGNEEYHAELLHTDTELTIYMLDGAATQPVPIEATALTINMTHNEVPKQFSLDAVPDRATSRRVRASPSATPAATRGWKRCRQSPKE